MGIPRRYHLLADTGEKNQFRIFFMLVQIGKYLNVGKFKIVQIIEGGGHKLVVGPKVFLFYWSSSICFECLFFSENIPLFFRGSR